MRFYRKSAAKLQLSNEPVTQQSNTSLQVLGFYEQDVCSCIWPYCAALLHPFLPLVHLIVGLPANKQEAVGVRALRVSWV